MADETWVEATRAYQMDDLNGMSWQTYVEKIKEADGEWLKRTGDRAVLGNGRSWERTIRVGNKVVKLPNWNLLETIQADVLIGEGRRDPAFWFLGANTGAGQANHLMRGEDCRDQRQTIHTALRKLDKVEPLNFPAVAGPVMADLLKIPRIGIGVASRLIALARPDCGLSVNSASRRRLADASGVSRTTLNRAQAYRRLLEWLVQQPWHKSKAPDDPMEREIWDIRAALFDALVYEPVVRGDKERKTSYHRDKPVSADAEPVRMMGDIGLVLTELFHATARELCEFLNHHLPTLGGQDWWQQCVIAKLKDDQRQRLSRAGATTLDQLDPAELLSVLDLNWYQLSQKVQFTAEARDYAKQMTRVRNRVSHRPVKPPPIADDHADLDTLRRFLKNLEASPKVIERVDDAMKWVRANWRD